MTIADKKVPPNPDMKKHTHRWSNQYHGIFNGPVRLCLNGRCGAIRAASGHIIVIRERVK